MTNFVGLYHFWKIPIHRYQAKAEGKVRLATGQALACAPESEVNLVSEIFEIFFHKKMVKVPQLFA